MSICPKCKEEIKELNSYAVATDTATMQEKKMTNPTYEQWKEHIMSESADLENQFIEEHQEEFEDFCKKEYQRQLDVGEISESLWAEEELKREMFDEKMNLLGGREK